MDSNHPNLPTKPNENAIPSDVEAAIVRLKKERNAVLLAHYYQESEIQDLADCVGDSLQLAQAAQKTQADLIVFAGVHFMAEVAKILNPSRKVLVPDLSASCSLADGCTPAQLAAWQRKYPGHVTVSYINCSAAVKAMSDCIVTSSNAEKILRSYPADQPLLFAPDQHLGRFLVKKTGRQHVVLYPGSCQVHELFSERELCRLKLDHPQAHVLAHPECEERVLSHAHFVGSTSALIRYAVENPASEFIIVTEPGVIHEMQKRAPHKTFLPAPAEGGCACNACPHMRKNTPEKIYLALRDLSPELTLPEDLRQAALKPLENMLSLS